MRAIEFLKRYKFIILFSCIIFCVVFLCINKNDNSESISSETIHADTTTVAEETTEKTTIVETTTVVTETTTIEITTTENTTENTTEIPIETTTVQPQLSIPDGEKPYLIAIDAGHQGRGNSEKEPIGPGATQMKAKVAGGTSGIVTGIPEYQLTLDVSLKLKQLLEQRGYQVLMIRESHDVNISNAERAQMANNAGADAFIRIHADGIDNGSVHGMSALCQTSANPYNGNLYSNSRKLSECVINSMAAETGARNRGIMETDSMSGINWAMIPVTIVEMGFMTNAEEDQKMQTEEYQQKLALGMANGIDAYFYR